MTNTKSKHIQILRGLAILAVVIIHTMPSGMYTVLLRPFFNFAVGLFLFLSGMLSDVNKYNPKKRILKVIVPYILWTLIYIVIKDFSNPTQIPVEFIKHLITGRAASTTYFIPLYCEFTLLIPLIDKLARSKFRYLGFLITPIEVLLMRTLPVILGYDLNSYIEIIIKLSCLGWFTYFYLGYLMGNNLITVKASTKKLTALLVASVPLQMLESYWRFSLGDTNSGTQMKLTAILTGSIFVILAYRFVNSEKEYNFRILEFFGNHSFGIFFSHPAIKYFFNLIPLFFNYALFPLNTVIIIAADILLIIVFKKLLGKHSKYLAF
ncbi:MAG: acyltransferase [Clostridia bacterium]|nr:acyltransferase [Clostridia bacterium]